MQLTGVLPYDLWYVIIVFVVGTVASNIVSLGMFIGYRFISALIDWLHTKELLRPLSAVILAISVYYIWSYWDVIPLINRSDEIEYRWCIRAAEVRMNRCIEVECRSQFGAIGGMDLKELCKMGCANQSGLSKCKELLLDYQGNQFYGN
jgi:hypothetical protein